MWEKEKFFRLILNRFNFSLFAFFFFLYSAEDSKANVQEQLINKYKQINTLSFNFTQQIGEKVEFGNCFIKYPLLMKCVYPKKKKSIVANGKKLAIIKKRYKKIYNYPLKKTPLFYLLNKDNILFMLENYEPKNNDAKIIEYELMDHNAGKIKIFFDKNSLDLSGWKTIDSYSNEVIFLIRNVKTNVLIKNKIFLIPNEEDL